MKAVGLFDNSAYFGFFYGGPKSNPYLHLFGVSLEKISFQVPSIDFTSAVYELYQTKGELNKMDKKFFNLMVCKKDILRKVFIYTWNEDFIRFYSLNQNKSFHEHNYALILFQLSENVLWFIPTDKPSCYQTFEILNPIFK